MNLRAITTTFLAGALLAACGSSSPPVETAAQEPEAQVVHEPEAQEPAAEEAVAEPEPPPPPATPRTNTIAATIAAGARLAPCAVELVHTTYDEDTREPTEQRVAVQRMVREWTDDLREDDFHGAAPVPLTLDQARAMLPRPDERTSEGGVVQIMTEVGDGMLDYRFDAEGRTVAVSWDPTADSSDYLYEYRYRCRPNPPARRRPQWVEDPES